MIPGSGFTAHVAMTPRSNQTGLKLLMTINRNELKEASAQIRGTGKRDDIDSNASTNSIGRSVQAQPRCLEPERLGSALLVEGSFNNQFFELCPWLRSFDMARPNLDRDNPKGSAACLVEFLPTSLGRIGR